MWVTKMTRHLMFSIIYCWDLLPEQGLGYSLILKNKREAQ